MPSLVRSVLVLSFLALGIAPVSWGGTPPARPAHAVIRVFLDDLAEIESLNRAGYDIASVDRKAATADLVVTPAELDAVERSGRRFVVLQVSRHAAPAFGERASGAETIEVDPLYKDYQEIVQFLNTTQQTYPSIAKRILIGGTHFPRAIYGMKISDNVAVDEDETTIFFNGQHHAREVMTPEVANDVIEYLTTRYGTDTDVTRWVNTHEIYVVPCVNPDGNVIVFIQDDFWRKNARDNNGNHVFDSGDGVDLNRNYPFQWGGACAGSSSAPTSETYRGPYSSSEPEVTSILQFERSIHPVFVVDWHSYAQEVYYAYGCAPAITPQLSTIEPPAPDRSISRVIGEEFASRLVQADGGLGFPASPNAYGVDGTSRDHQYHEVGTMAFVVELNTGGEGGFHPSYATWRNPTVVGQRPGWQYLLDRIDGASIGGHVRNARTGAPLMAEVSLDEMTVHNGEVYYSEPSSGRYHFIVVPGTYHVRARAAGFLENAVTVTVGASTAVTDIALEPVDGIVLMNESFENLPAWTVGGAGDDATAGQWVNEDPFGSFTGTHPGTVTWAAPEFDRSVQVGVSAYVTGNPQAPAFGAGDIDGGTTSLSSPAIDAASHYGVRLGYWRRFFKSGTDPQDTLVGQISNDGGLGWTQLEQLTTTTASPTQAQAWTRAEFLLDTLLPVTGNMKIRFRATDRIPDNTVEAAVDDVVVTAIPFSSAPLDDLTVGGAGATVVSFDAAPGGPSYDVIRGDLSQLFIQGAEVSLGQVVCLEEDSADPDTSEFPDTASPAEGQGFFYLARLNLGYSVGSWGQGTGGLERIVDPASPSRCSP